MSAKLLQEFFRAKKADADKVDPVNWAARKDEWIAAVEELYTQIAELLAPSINDGSVVASTSVTTITEDHIGQYDIEKLKLVVGDESVVFSPVGTLVVGASGRVDVTGDEGRRMLIVQRDDPKWRWSIVASTTPTLRAIPVDADNLLEALKAVMR